MLSLHDKIQKFNKLVYSKQLDEFIPIDDQFLGHGITMQSLIKQNAFIIEQLKKIKTVFINYCKLNQNVYQKITEHQISQQKQTNKLKNLTNSVQHKLKQTLGQIKQISQQLKYQINKSKQMTHQVIKPLEQQIKKKVDQTSFKKQMKKIIQEIDADDYQHNQQDGQQTQQRKLKRLNGQLQQNDDKIFSNIKKKKGKAIYENQFNQQKQRTSQLLSQLSQKLQNINNKNIQNQNLLYKNTSTINNIFQQQTNYQDQIYKLNRNINQTSKLISICEQKLMRQIDQKTNQNIWNKKFQKFQNQKVKPNLQQINQTIIRKQQESQKIYKELQNKCINIQIEMKNIEHNLDKVRRKNEHLSVHLIKIQQTFKNNLTQLSNQTLNIQKHCKQQNQNIKQSLLVSTNSLQQKISSLSTSVSNISKQLSQSITKTVLKHLQLRFSQTQQNIRKIRSNQKQKSSIISKLQIQIINIKELLCKKANFDDLVINFDRKVDRDDFKEFKQKMSENNTFNNICINNGLKSTILGVSQRGNYSKRSNTSTSHRKTQNTSRNQNNAVSSFNNNAVSSFTNNNNLLNFNTNNNNLLNSHMNAINFQNIQNLQQKQSLIDFTQNQKVQTSPSGYNKTYMMGLAREQVKRRMSFTENTRRRKSTKINIALL